MEYVSHAPQDTEELARQLAGVCAGRGTVITLKGELGVGKSVFARAFIRRLCGENTHVPSPTFTIVQPYDVTLLDSGMLTLFHYDLYRLDAPEEIVELDIEDAMSEGICLIEWPEIIAQWLPDDHITVEISSKDGEPDIRVIHIAGHGHWKENMKEWYKANDATT